VVQGPANILTNIAGAGLAATINIGDQMVAASAATTGATTSGRLMSADYQTGSTGLTLAAMIVNRIGRAMSAATTNNTNTGILVDVGY
jgi:hypothetical protein